MLIAIEGIDGAGKSTVVDELTHVLKGTAVEAACVNKKEAGDVTEEVAARAKVLSELIWSEDAPVDELGTRHWMLLIAAWYSALDRFQPLFHEHDGRVVIVDGWYYRNIAKAIVRAGIDERWLESLFDSVLRPDLVVFLDVEPEVAWARGVSFADLELGRWDGFDGEPRDAFRAYQSRIRQELSRMSSTYGWVRIAPETTLPPRAVAEAVVELIPATYLHTKAVAQRLREEH